jgi:tRNA-Thr(GGU) m(6)t(6)A37 methyltransferase TsaA
MVQPHPKSRLAKLEKKTSPKLHFIGVVEKEGEQEARIRIFEEYCAGLKGIQEYSHLIILYWSHLRDNEKDRQILLVTPKRHALNVEKGVFACRSPSRPNPIALCVTQLLRLEKCTLTVRGLDSFEASPIIDIKPYLPRADLFPNAHAPAWTEEGPPT